MCLQGRAACRVAVLLAAVVVIILVLPENNLSKLAKNGLSPIIWKMSLFFYMEPRNHYERLGVSRQATTREIKKAYRAKSLKVLTGYHFDFTDKLKHDFSVAAGFRVCLIWHFYQTHIADLIISRSIIQTRLRGIGQRINT